MSTPAHLEAVRKAAELAERADATLKATIQEAAQHHSLRSIAEAAKMSHESVRRIRAN